MRGGGGRGRRGASWGTRDQGTKGKGKKQPLWWWKMSRMTSKKHNTLIKYYSSGSSSNGNDNDKPIVSHQ